MSKVKIEVKRVIGSQTPFWQGGSLRIILPKRIVRKYCKVGLRADLMRSGIDEIPFVFIETDKGILMKPLAELLEDVELKGGLGFTHPSGLSLEELQKLINELVEEE